MFGLGQTKDLKAVAVRDMQRHACSGVIYIAAATVAGLEYYKESDSSGAIDGGGERVLAATETTSSAYGYGSSPTNHIPILFCLFGHVGERLFLSTLVICFFPNDGSHKEMYVDKCVILHHKRFHFPVRSLFPPVCSLACEHSNVRIMLMLGESVFSLLIVAPLEDPDYYTSFFCSLLTVILLQYLHFKSQPEAADHHAMRRSKNAVCYGRSFKKYTHWRWCRWVRLLPHF